MKINMSLMHILSMFTNLHFIMQIKITTFNTKSTDIYNSNNKIANSFFNYIVS